MKNNLIPYTEKEIDVLMNSVQNVADQPYHLFAAYAISCLYDAIAPIDEEEVSKDVIWGLKASKRVVDRLVADVSKDFEDAAHNYKGIRIWGNSYPIRKASNMDFSRLKGVFNFPIDKGEYSITKDGIMNTAPLATSQSEAYKVSCDEAKANRNYVRQIIMLAEDDAGNGWNKLTDMEVIVYLWALFYNKHHSHNLREFKQVYKDYLYITDKDIEACYNDRSIAAERPEGMYPFSVRKVLEWNKTRHQKSLAVNIPEEEAEDYWYDKALKKSFKPT